MDLMAIDAIVFYFISSFFLNISKLWNIVSFYYIPPNLKYP